MNRKVYKIWMLLLDNPGKWFYTDEVAFEMDLTRKQMYALLSKFPSPPVERERINSDSGLKIRINGSEQYLQRVRESITIDWFKITDEMCDKIRATLPKAGWVTLTDLSMDTGYTTSQLAKALTLMDDVVTHSSHGVPLFKLVGDTEDV